LRLRRAEYANLQLLSLFDQAVEEYASELDHLRFLPENRYNTDMFPITGQYDWFSGQLLYCIVRYLKPIRVIEISTNSGYSSLFSALALKANRVGRLETFELLPKMAEAAQANFERFEVAKHVRLHVGDARETVAALLSERVRGGQEILFLDSEHTEEFARWFLGALVLSTSPESLFHMHDILPPTASVRFLDSKQTRTVAYRLLCKFRFRSLLRHYERNHASKFDVDGSTEARLGHRLSGKIPADAQVYCHDILDRYPVLEAKRYDSQAIRRYSSNGKPMEWNESWWVVCRALQMVLS
jgi:predicted O-methyltransferase YrrM